MIFAQKGILFFLDVSSQVNTSVTNIDLSFNKLGAAGAAALAAVANRRQILVSGSVERQCHDLDARGMGMAQLEQADAATEEAAQEVLWLLTDSRMNVGRLPLHLPD